MTEMLISNATIVNEGKKFIGNVLIKGEKIAYIGKETPEHSDKIDGTGLHLLPGVIDDQVHFREPGLTHKAEIETESKAAIAGGTTSFMEMPNTVPNTLTQDLLQDKYDRAAECSYANYSFYMGASNDNIEEVLKTDPTQVCGVKVFMGSSTGNMLVDKAEVLEQLFSQCDMLIATHCEDEATIRANAAAAREKYGENVPIAHHPILRSHEACYRSSSMAVELATKHNSRLHILHISTAKELELFTNKKALEDKNITAEACIHHLWFTDEDYAKKGTHIKWNPAVKMRQDRDAILEAVKDNTIDVIATDHAPHSLEEKSNLYFQAPSGGPLIQHSLVALLELVAQGKITLEHVVQKTSHDVARCFGLQKRGFIREGYFADLVLVDLNKPWLVERKDLHYKCGWSPFEGTNFSSAVETTIINGNIAFDKGVFADDRYGQRLTFSEL